ncbi:hypothetical protein EST38_g10672 [Candolleomyces aberdarensis]|uniref:Uncharacterized protein n=1 Tax=Candolleomyces aberdarensis TaxID=2316362 RepID=A0A4Q2D8D9_9AGAR|nr:hypothetical protein EST38_g10672 [Candolleomyces aberdarensis]
MTYVSIPVKGDEPMVLIGIVIGSNLSEEDMELAKRPELVKEVQDLLEIDTPAAWYRFGQV